MARRKKNPAILSKLEQRLAGLKSIGPEVDLGNGLSTDSFAKEVKEFRMVGGTRQSDRRRRSRAPEHTGEVAMA